jgi:virginiamycin B lyase
MQACASRPAIFLAVLALLGGCAKSSIPAALPAGPAAGRSAATVTDSRRGGKQKVKMLIKVPRAPKHARGKALRPYFVASSTQGVKIVVYANAAHTTQLATTVAGLTPANCSPVTGGRVCLIDAASPVGSNLYFGATTYDKPPSGGNFGSAKQLGVGFTTLPMTVTKGIANVIHLTLGGVVAKAVVALTTASVPVIETETQSVTVSAQDADSNTIVSNGWFDATGNAVTMDVSSNAPSIFFSPPPAVATFAAPTTTLTYEADEATPTQIRDGFVATITATPSNAGAVAGHAALTLAKPAITEYATTTTYLEGITVGPDNALWFAENAADKIGRVTTTGTLSEFGAGITHFAGPTSIAAGQDGNLWFTEFGLGKVASITTSGTVAEYLTPSGAGDQPWGIAAGPDGNMWFTEDCNAHSNIGKFNAAAMDSGTGLIKEFTTATANSGPQQIATGPDNQIWFTESLVDKIGRITTSGTGAADYALASNSIGEGGMTTGPDDALWFAEENPNAGNKIGRITTSGTVTLPGTLATTFSSPQGIVTGPDGAIWFTENGNNAIGRISPTDATHTIVEFPLPHPNGNPFGIVKGPDGALWFTECLSGKIGRLQ